MSVSSKKSLLSRVALILIFLIALYFVLTRAIEYFVFTEESYGKYFWPRVNWVFPHVLCGTIALLIGPFQFSKKLRAKNVKLHRRIGYTYLIAILIGSIASLGLAFTSKVNITYMMGLAFLAVAWLLTSGMAFFCILKRKIMQHKEWMTRSYVVTFAFVVFRLFSDILKHYEIMEHPATLLSWAAWAVPLLFTEVFIQYRKTFK